MQVNQIIHGDSLEIMKSLPDNSIDLVLTDPPYFGIVKNDWDNQWDNLKYFINWLELYTKEWKRVLKDNGSIYIFGDDKIVAYIQVMMDKYFKLENSIIWNKGKSYLTSKGWGQFNSYAPVTERLLFYSNEIVNINGKCVNNTRDYIRNEIIKAKGKIVLKDINIVLGVASNGGGVASAVLSLEKTEPVMITEEHYLKLRGYLNGKEYKYLRKEYKYLRKEYEDLRKEYEDLRRPFSPEENYTDVWTFNMTAQKEKWAGKHPTIKPLELFKRIIQTSSRKGDIILDCFAGSGTTAVACIETGRKYIVIEKEEKYVDIIKKRVKNTTPPLFIM